MLVRAHLRLDRTTRRSAQLDVIVRLGGLLDRDAAALVPRLALQIDLVAELGQLAQQRGANARSILALAFCLGPRTCIRGCAARSREVACRGGGRQALAQAVGGERLEWGEPGGAV